MINNTRTKYFCVMLCVIAVFCVLFQNGYAYEKSVYKEAMVICDLDENVVESDSVDIVGTNVGRSVGTDMCECGFAPNEHMPSETGHCYYVDHNNNYIHLGSAIAVYDINVATFKLGFNVTRGHIPLSR